MKEIIFFAVWVMSIARITWATATNQSSTAKFVRYKHAREKGLVLHSTLVEFSNQCARLCVREDGCNLYNLGPKDDWTRRMRCELVTRNSTAVDVSGAGADGWVMYVRKGG